MKISADNTLVVNSTSYRITVFLKDKFDVLFCLKSSVNLLLGAEMQRDPQFNNLN